MAGGATGRVGKVYLVGAGPGDPELITLRGLRLIETADVILYDNLAPTTLLSRAPVAAVTLYVGKKRARHAYTQEQINQALIGYARQGKRVVGSRVVILTCSGAAARRLKPCIWRPFPSK